MFSAVANLVRGPVELTVGVAFERRFRLFAINRRGIVFDTRFAPPVDGSTDAVIVYLLIEGELLWDNGWRVVGPALFLMRETDFEGESGTRPSTFRSWGTPFRAVELRIAPGDCSEDVGQQVPSPIALDGPRDPILTAGRLYLHASHTKKGQTTVAKLASDYLGALRAHGVLATDLAATITYDEGLRGRMWSVISPFVERFGAGAVQGELVDRLGWSPRRVQRELGRMAIAFGVLWLGSWRDVVLRYRVRVAVMLLSNPALSVGDVADAVGYASVEALAHALHGCGLSSASELRKALAIEPPPLT